MTRRFATWIALTLVLAGESAPRAEEPGSESSPADSRPALDNDLEARLRAMEAMNRRLLEEFENLRRNSENDRRVADERYRALEDRYHDLLDRLDSSPATGRPEDLVSETRPTVPAGSLPFTGSGTERGRGSGFEGTDPERIGVSLDAQAGNVFGRPDPPDGWPLLSRFDDGFELSSPDDELTLRFHILDQTDFKNFLPNDLYPARSGLYIPRVRVYFEGELTRKFEYEVSLQRSVEGVWDLLDGNLNMIASEGLQIQFGRMLVPYSYDWYDHLEQFFITPERGLFPLNFGLSRSAGLMAHGFLREGRFQYALGGFDGRLSGIADDNNIRDAVGYFNARPFLLSSRFPALRYLNIGGSIFGGQQILPDVGTPLPLRTSLQSSENDEAAQAASATFLEFEEDVRSLGSRAAGAIHLAWYYKQLSFEAEWQSGRFEYAKLHRSGSVSVPVTGFHAGFGYFLTGEEVDSRTTVIPLRPLELHRGRRGPGAVELFARYSQIDLGESVFSGELADPDLWTRHVYMADIGFNWYPNRFVKFYFDWQLPFYANPVLVNSQEDLFSRHGSMFWIRCQVWF